MEPTTMQAQSTERYAFGEVSEVSPRGEGRFEAEVHPEWTILGKPNGGYLLAMMGRAAAAVGDHPHVTAASAHYVGSPEPGRVAIDTEVLRAGRSASQVRVRMTQGGRLCVEALVTTSRLDPGSVPYWDGGLPPFPPTSYEDCERLVPRTPDGTRVAIMEQIDVLLEPSSLGFLAGRPSGRGELRGWLGLPHGESFDPISLVFAVDAYPPATFEVELAGWVPTLELTVYVRALPALGPVRILQRAQLIEAQRVDEACFVWDSRGRLVAQGTQLAGIRLG
jgi:acyl-coenzyme A thioesterase PaaI-like protein